MRRLLAILIAFLVGLPTVTPLFVLTTDADPSRPVCCRRDGKHHCMLADMDTGSVTPSSRPGLNVAMISDRCPYGAKSVPVTPRSGWTLDTAKAIFAGIVAHPAIAPQSDCKRRTSADRSRQKRGPPASSFA